MSERFAPYEYDHEHLKRIYMRITNSVNISDEFRPPKGSDREAVADAMLGIYLENAEQTFEKTGDKKEYESELARVAFTVEYLRGTPLELIEPKIEKVQHPDIPVLEFVLGSVSDAARSLGGKPVSMPKPRVSEHEKLEKSDIIRGFKVESLGSENVLVVPEFFDLHKTVVDLFHEGKIDRYSAQSLIVMFQIRESNASREDQLKALNRAKRELRQRTTIVRKRMNTKPGKKRTLDYALEEGLEYIDQRLGDQKKRILVRQLPQIEQWVRRNKYPNATFSDIHKHVRSCVGLGIYQLYNI